MIFVGIDSGERHDDVCVIDLEAQCWSRDGLQTGLRAWRVSGI
jgi:hypothetical protein